MMHVRVAGVLGLMLVSGCAIITGLDHTYKRDDDDDGGEMGEAPICPDMQQLPKELCLDSPDWLSDVFPIFASDKADCTIGGCHGTASSHYLYLPSNDAKASYDALTKYEGGQKYPYVNLADPKHSWILCNLEGTVGSPMPPGVGLTPEDLETVRKWAICGMPYDSCDDGVKDTNETYVDCGGACPLGCADGKGCGSDADCASSSCWDGVCRSCMDNVKNGMESDVDCGEHYCAPNKCADGKMCGGNGDCQSGMCVSGTCQS